MIRLTKGPQQIVLLYQNKFLGAVIDLLWAPREGALQVVPAAALRPERAGGGDKE